MEGEDNGYDAYGDDGNSQVRPAGIAIIATAIIMITIQGGRLKSSTDVTNIKDPSANWHLSSALPTTTITPSDSFPLSSSTREISRHLYPPSVLIPR